MHTLLHEPHAKALAAERLARPTRAPLPPGPPEPPPSGRARTSLAHLLALAASRVDREAAERALA